MRRLFLGLFAFTAVASVVSESRAHIELTYPAPRYTGNATQKVGPCGMLNDTRGNNITYLEPGATITVTWHETVGHPGHYRIMFDDNGFDGFPEPATATDFCQPGVGGCLADNIPDVAGSGMYSQEITLPNIECDNCTLQVIQLMTDKPPYGNGDDLYYRCADIVLQAGGGPASSSSSAATTTAAGTGGAGTTTSTGSAAGGNDGAGGDNLDLDDSGGCSFGAGDAPPSGALAALALLGLAVGARRRRSS